jgi:hypothetical protein
VLDRNGAVRPLVGIAGNLLAGEPLATAAVSAAASGAAILVKTSTDVRALDPAGNEKARAQTAGGPALFAFAMDGSPEFVWVAQTQTLLRQCPTGFCDCRLRTEAIAGNVLAIGTADRNHIDLAISRNAAIEVLRVRLADGAIENTTPLPGASGAPLLMADGAMLYAVPGELVLRDSRGRERRTPFAHSASSIVPMSAGWALIAAAGEGRHFAVRLADGATFQIPEVQ